MKEKMFVLALQVMKNAYAPFSNYHVGACLLSEDDQLFTGCNVENTSFGLTQCAEASAVGNLVSSGKKTIKEVLVIGSGDEFCTPCGACRQRLWELAAKPDIPIHLCNQQGIQKTVPLNQLLPLAFTSKHWRNT